MVTLYDAPADALIEALAGELSGRIEEPAWATFAKSGPGREFPPEDEDFWYVRAASVLRRVAMDGPVGVDRLSTYYGGPKDGSTRYRVAPTHRSDGSEKLLRRVLQQLEEEGLVERPPNDEGRVVSAEGQRLLDTTAGEVLESLDRPELDRYV
jgi:small subunit ribosomal protein S19e